MNVRNFWRLNVTLALAVAACDPRDPALDGSAELAPAEELDAMLDYCADLQAAGAPAVLDVPELTDVPDVAEGVCSAGHYETRSDPMACGDCDFTPGVKGKKYLNYKRFCYDPPSPPSCGQCEPWEYYSFSCVRC